ncbi:hypothetical protein BMS3Bbin02_01165 [bacterium BMS3Bbin02]|nr:hypothetical protein BMS3Bbin02_01165 [bacterium BMS3Bbin02]
MANPKAISRTTAGSRTRPAIKGMTNAAAAMRISVCEPVACTKRTFVSASGLSAPYLPGDALAAISRMPDVIASDTGAEGTPAVCTQAGRPPRLCYRRANATSS